MEGNTQVNYTICLNTLNNNNLTRHQNDIHKPSVKNMYKCQYCTYSSNRSFNLRKHQNAIHKTLVTEKIEYHSTIGVSVLKNEIVQSENEYQTKIELLSEIKKMYKCQDCTFTTNWSTDLRRHEKFVHKPSVKQLYKCQDCTYSTHWPYNLIRHENAMHKPLITEKIEYNSTIDVCALKNKIVRCDNEYQTKIELGREIKKIVQELNVNIACLDKEDIAALELFENHEQIK